jgi:hypothetical protein
MKREEGRGEPLPYKFKKGTADEIAMSPTGA